MNYNHERLPTPLPTALPKVAATTNTTQAARAAGADVRADHRRGPVALHDLKSWLENTGSRGERLVDLVGTGLLLGAVPVDESSEPDRFSYSRREARS